jgi:hypothetical protein
MVRNPHGRVVGGETAGFEKLVAALNHASEAAMGLHRRVTRADFQTLTQALRECIEASTEISTRRSDPRWFALTPSFEKMLTTANSLNTRTTMRGGSQVPAEAWRHLALRFQKIQRAAQSLWQDAERDAVQGSSLEAGVAVTARWAYTAPRSRRDSGKLHLL